MENSANNIEKKKISRKTKIVIISAAVVLVAGTSVYAVNTAAGISEAEARQIALEQVGGADHSHITKFHRDMDDGREEYDVEIIYGGYEYDFEISAKDGRIYDQSKEPLEADDIAGLPPSSAQLPAVDGSQPAQSVTIEVQPESKHPADAEASQNQQSASGSDSGNQPQQQTAQSQSQPAQSQSPADIGLEKAKSIALSEVSGASSGDIVAAWNDYDDGRLEYDVEIRYDGCEYEFEIDGATGKILGKDVDRIDDGYSDYYYD